MSMIDERLQNALSRLLPDDAARVNAVLDRLAQRDAGYREQFARVLEAEADQSFFAPGHYEATLPEKPFFDYVRSTEFGELLGMVFPGPDPAAQIAASTERISQGCSSEQIAAALDREAYFVFPQRLPESLVDRIVDGLKQVDFAVNGSHRMHRIASPEDLRPVEDNTCWAVDQQEVLAIPEVQGLLMDPVLLDAMSRYLGCPPIHVQTNSWWSKAESHDERSLRKSAQLFHQDKEFIKFLKVFVYLNDVTEDNGPHQFIAGSNKDYLEHVPAGYKFSQRLSDEYLAATYDRSRFQSFTGRRGTVVIEDTSGFHKGKPVISGQRLILQLEFAASLYFNPIASFGFEGLTPAYLEFLQRNPRFSLNYDNDRHAHDLSRDLQGRLRNRWKNTAKSLKKKLLGRGRAAK